MALNQINRPNSINDDIVDIKKQSLYARLKTLFSSETIVRNVGGKQLIVKDTDHSMMAGDRNSLRDRFNRIRSTAYNAYSRDFSLSYQAARIEMFRDYQCVAGETIIPLPDGTYPTIAELAEKYKNKPQERFYVYSYDHESNSIKLGNAYHPRKKDGGKLKAWKLTFEKGKYIIASGGHPFLMRNGDYKKLEDIKVGDSIMPFYQKDFYNKGYRHVYNFSKGWQPEHNVIAEQFNRPLKDNEVVHHQQFNPSYNMPDNLVIMDKTAHKQYHIKLVTDKMWSFENKQKTLEKIHSSEGYKNRKFHHWNGERSGTNNPFYGKIHTKESNEVRSKSLKTYCKTRNYNLGKNPNYRDELTFDIIKEQSFEYYRNYGKLNLKEVSKYLHCDISLITNRLKSNNHNWKSFKQEIFTKLNHKVKSIEYVGEIDVYDVTVEKYQNFASDTVFSHNTMDMDPILNATLDIVADECIEGNTIIPLLNGDKVKIEDLYNQNKTDFWVYSIDSDGNFKPEKCERVAYNGIKPMYKVLLDDGTEIKCTSNHMWVKSDMSIISTDKLELGTSLKIFNTKLSNFKFMNGYEMLYINGKWQFTHRLVAKNEPSLITQRETVCETDKVIHHSSFNKLNNSPEYLKWVGYIEHKKIHSQFNKEIWADKTKTHEYKEKTREGHRRYWNDETRKYHSENCHFTMLKRLEGMSKEDRNKEFGRNGNKNGMFGNGYKLTKNKNGRWIEAVNRFEHINMEEYEKDIINGLSRKELKQKYNILREDCSVLNKQICNKYNITRIDRLKYKIIGYNSYADYTKSNNHRVISVEPCGEYKAYDLVNVGTSSHLYAIETKDGSKLFTHNCLTTNALGKMLTVHCENNNVKEILENLYDDILNLDFNLWGWLRNTLKLGDHFLKVYVSPEYGVYMVEPINAENVERIENADPYNKKYVKFQIRPTDTSQAEVLENWQICHFRLTGDSNFFPYGRSYLEGARRIWKQLSLLEDAMMIHRVVRAPERRIFYVDIGNIPPAEVDNYMQKLQDKIKKVPYMNERGEYNLKFNLQNMLDDFYIPTRGSDSGTRIDTLPGMDWTGIDDVEYLKNKMFAALKIPKTFLNFGEEGGSKATLSNEDIRFARTIQRIQKILCVELEKIGVIHLYAQGYRDESLINFKIELTNSSTILEKEKISILSEKTALSTDMMESGLFSPEYIYKYIFQMSNDDIETEMKSVIEFAKRKYRLAAIENDGDDPAMPMKKIGTGGGGGEKGEGGGLGGLGGGGGHGGGGGLSDLGDLEGEGEEGEGNKEGGEGNEEEPNPETEEKPKIGKPEDIVKEDANRDQSGEHKASDHPFGEDPLGHLELNRKPRKNSEFKKKSELYQNFEGDSPYALEEIKKPVQDNKQMKNRNSKLILSLSEFFDKPIDVKKELIKESTLPSMLDEVNIKEIL